MLHAGLDLSRTRLDFCLLDELGGRVEVGVAPPDGDAGAVGFLSVIGRDARVSRLALRALRAVDDVGESLGVG